MPAPSDLRPFLKWAGGKRQLLAELRCFYPASMARYVEPFVGSGAVFFDLCASGRLSTATSVLSDENADLVGTYLRVADSTDAVLRELRQLADGHRRREREHYYTIRNCRFNPERQQWREHGGDPADYPVAIAAMLLYLNRTGYNGLFRLNANGHFNVPAGRYRNPAIVHEDRLRAAAAALSSPRVQLRHAPFEDALADVARGDFVYLDPPYAPLSATANFRSYTARGFLDADQQRLRDTVLTIAARGVHVLLSNSTAASVVALYDNRLARAAGLRCYRVPARRAINSRGSARGVIEELLVTTLRRATPTSGAAAGRPG